MKRKKLSRQYAVMFFAVQMILTVIISILVRMESINNYLSAKNDMISELLKKEARALDLDNANPSPAWCFDYWKAHYTEFGSDIEAYEASLCASSGIRSKQSGTEIICWFMYRQRRRCSTLSLHCPILCAIPIFRLICTTSAS